MAPFFCILRSMDDQIFDKEVTEESDNQENTALDAIVDQTFLRYQEMNFNFVEINSDPILEPKYRELRQKYGDDGLTKDEINIFYTELGALNCSLVSDWSVADIKEHYPNTNARKLLMTGLKVNKPISEPITNTISHAFVTIEHDGQEIFFEPQTGEKFPDLVSAIEHYTQSWPLPEGYKYFAI